MARNKRPKLKVVDNAQMVMNSEYDQQLEADERQFANVRLFWSWAPGQQDTYIQWVGNDDPLQEYKRVIKATGRMIRRTTKRIRLRFGDRCQPELTLV